MADILVINIKECINIRISSWEVILFLQSDSRKFVTGFIKLFNFFCFFCWKNE